MLEIALVVLMGIIIGSFLNVCIYRIPKGESIVFPGSQCTNCGHSLSHLDLVPILSFLILKGKCRYCDNKISKRYMMIEILTGLMFGGVYLRFGWSLETLLYAGFMAVLIVLTMIDLDEMLLPTKIIWFGAGIGLIFRALQSILYQDIRYLGASFLAALLGYGFFWVLFYMAKILFKKEGLGFGDVRLAGMLGIYLPINLIVFTIFVSSLLASIYGGMLFYKKKASEPFSFGPFLNIAAVIALFYGDDMIWWYLGFIRF
jgi:leader peptidase (prepilin peptidase)/N-methyltransferase